MQLVFAQFLTGLASASSLFLVASGLSIIFGVTRIVNFAHGAFYMLGAYIAFTLTEHLTGAFGFWGGLIVASIATALLGAALEITLLRRIYKAPELFQLLATFGVTLMVEDLVLLIWGPDDLLGPRAPGLRGAVMLFGSATPSYDLFLIALSPLVLGVLWLLFHRTHWGVLVRAATEDREMVAALGVNQKWLFTGVFALGCFLAALGGALQIPRDAVNHTMDLRIIVEVFVVVVIGGLGSTGGAFVAALLVSELNAFGILILPRVSLVLIFAIMAVVLIIRPSGLFGKAVISRPPAQTALKPWAPLAKEARIAVLALVGLAALLPLGLGDYGLNVASEILIFVLFAASLHLIMSAGGLASFGHAAFFGLGAYGAALAVKGLALPMGLALIAGPVLAAIGAVLAGAFVTSLSGVYFAMLTLAFAQICWSVAFQWVEVTGGDNGILGIWPTGFAASPSGFYWLVFALTVVLVAGLRMVILSPFGYGLRAARDSALRAEAIGLDGKRVQWAAFILSGTVAGLAGALFAFLKGSVFPELTRHLGLGRRAGDGAAGRCGHDHRAHCGGGVLQDAVDLADQSDGLFPAGAGCRHRGAGGGLSAGPRRNAGRDAVALAAARGSVGGSNMTALLEARNLAKSYGGVQAVKDVSFTLAPGEILALIGPNGAGKSTCFNMLNGQIVPDTGSVFIEGKSIDGLPPRRVCKLGTGRTFQITATFGSMTVRENILVALASHQKRSWRMWGRLETSAACAEADRLLALVGIGDQGGQPAAEMAYGDLKRLELAIALANAPRLLLMDEPTAGMASRERVELMRLAAGIAREQNMGILFTEHDMDVVFEHADRVMVLSRGLLIAEGTPEEIRANAEVRAIYLGDGLLYAAGQEETVP